MLIILQTAGAMSTRTVMEITGTDARKFLQNLVSNDVNKLSDGLVYTALLTPQGKYLADFFLVPWGDAILLDVATPLAADLMKRLTMYRLRADVAITVTDLRVSVGLGPAQDGAFADPRDAHLGWRSYGPRDVSDPTVDWTALRVAHGIPEFGFELGTDSFILEMGFARLNGVDFRKGCYVGQEVTARMKHKTELRKGLARITFDGPVSTHDTLSSDGKAAGTVHSVSGNQALCYLRFDRDHALTTGTANATQIEPMI